MLQLRLHPLHSSPSPPLRILFWGEGPDTQAHVPTDMAFYESGLEWGAGGSTHACSVRGAVLHPRPQPEQWNQPRGTGVRPRCARGWGSGSQSPALRSGLSVSGPPAPSAAPLPSAPRACSHAASSRRSPAELISTTSTYRSLAGCQAGRHGASADCGAPGRVEHSFGGRGTPSLAAPRTPFRKRTPVSLGVDHSLATSACLRWKRQSEAESKGGPPSSAPPPPPYKSEEQRGRWGRRL